MILSSTIFMVGRSRVFYIYSSWNIWVGDSPGCCQVLPCVLHMSCRTTVSRFWYDLTMYLPVGSYPCLLRIPYSSTQYVLRIDHSSSEETRVTSSVIGERGWSTSSSTVLLSEAIRGYVEVKYLDACQYLGAGVRWSKLLPTPTSLTLLAWLLKLSQG